MQRILSVLNRCRQKTLPAVILMVALAGCSGAGHADETAVPAESGTERAEETQPEIKESETVPPSAASDETVINEVDYSPYFNGLNGCAVFYTPARNQYDIYNPALAEKQRSPCSTFKIISSLLALQEGVIEPSDSVRKWNGELFWNAEWNRDIDFSTAFQTSCVWYFRQVIDELGRDKILTI